MFSNIPSLPILVNLMMEATRSSESSVPTRATQRHIPEDGIPLKDFTCKKLQELNFFHGISSYLICLRVLLFKEGKLDF
jgi:hypothetical protein